MGDVSSDHSQSSGDGIVEETMLPEREPISGKSDQGSLGDPSSDLTQSIEPPGISRQTTDSTNEHQSASLEHSASDVHRANPPSLNMSEIVSALPSYQSPSRSFLQQNIQMQFVPTHQPQGMMYPVAQMPYASPNAPGGAIYNMPYSPPFHNAYIHQNPQLQGAYSPYPTPHHQSGAPMHPHSPGYSHPFYTQHQYSPGYGELQGVTPNTRIEGQTQIFHHYRQAQLGITTRESEKQRASAGYDVSSTIVDGSSRMKQSGAPLAALGHNSARQSSVVIPIIPPRGPPRKPKQSGHALWVGNLPPSTNVVDLKDHFSKDATSDIESVFLISKSNCAFVNYKSEAACAAAVARFHDSRFQGVRLVCRLRRGATAASFGQNNPLSARPSDEGEAQAQEEGKEKRAAEERLVSHSRRPSRVPDRFFIVKSLTLEDLELSRRSGIWATQTHNEAALNRAYESADNVYLIFSANKSGEYFGYARMVSAITDDEALALEAPPRPEIPPSEADDLEVIPTEATETAPKGRIIDDSARGTIFWEADSSEDSNDDNDDGADSQGNDNSDNDEENDDNRPGEDVKNEKGAAELGGEDLAAGGQTFGKPFRIEWISTERLPFYRTRGLRNPWNSNREVKIARDGTEIEPSVGRKLIQLFHIHPSAMSSGAQQGPGFQRPY
ncbi:YT521-B-like splicing factor, putative [Talaromyces stipitatus ATCC 10500]|uniref:YT521-B-like splicing factor, putative n=1 Tax=Talaromyces stipitatus (strain ATCC 10500 / CBS 375.48 / QM 6759 / NRRL 1006) TaxID=441959 RepID=B8M0U8_TALSN|nr:YT521-B-like splicing factor, putative [Talaromyces stipitatus ATCC 10500]EED21728.1 YT521-B-like splicing factor, putative [Talaromyces stipitatus ATCC 10500]